MEPDVDKIVSNKIRETELRPVQWNKQEVWRKVQSETGAKRPYYAVYFAAAALVLLLIYFNLQMLPKEMERQSATAEVKQNGDAAEPTTSPIPSTKGNDAPDPVVNRETIATVREPNTRNRPRKASEQSEPKTDKPDPDLEPVVTDIEIQKAETAVVEEVAIQERKIKPVVGIIIEFPEKNIASVKRKKRLRKLNSPDPQPWVDPGTALVFAVRK
ncbi:MAG: hypothetical protein M3Y60_02215 [Bacteroidota bacterium]|nr:hypothetical protein [Bacteroidota bacterium]